RAVERAPRAGPLTLDERATAIQTAYRAYSARRQLSVRRAALAKRRASVTEAAAATVIQSAWRSALARAALQGANSVYRAARVIQAIFRRTHAKNLLAKKRLERQQLREKALLTEHVRRIQQTWRAFVARREAHR